MHDFDAEAGAVRHVLPTHIAALWPAPRAPRCAQAHALRGGSAQPSRCQLSPFCGARPSDPDRARVGAIVDARHPDLRAFAKHGKLVALSIGA